MDKLKKRLDKEWRDYYKTNKLYTRDGINLPPRWRKKVNETFENMTVEQKILFVHEFFIRKYGTGNYYKFNHADIIDNKEPINKPTR